MPAVKKYQLKSNESSNTLIFGILCDEKEYKVSWLLNQYLGINLARSTNIIWTNKKLPNTLEFACYKDSETYPESVFLIKNKTIEGHKLGEYSQFDYLLIVPKLDKDWKSHIRGIKEVRGVFELDPTGMDGIELL